MPLIGTLLCRVAEMLRLALLSNGKIERGGETFLKPNEFKAN